jgi:hypothetical protein
MKSFQLARQFVLCVATVAAAASLWNGVGPLAPATALAETAPMSKVAIFSIATKQLSREYRLFQKDRTSPIRTKSDFFTTDPPAGGADKANVFTADDVLTALERNIPGDVRIACYVKWQLLSAMPAELEPAAVRRLMALYRDAPKPFARYGIAPAERDKLDQLMAYPHKSADPFNRDLKNAADQANASNEPIFAYRDDLYQRLPDGPAKF